MNGPHSDLDIPLTWLQFAWVMAPPTVVWCALVLIANRITLRPEAAPSMTQESIRGEMERMGPLSRPELLTAVIVLAVAFLTVVVPDWALKQGAVAKLSRIAQDVIGTGLWALGLVAVLGGLWYAHRESRV